MLPYIGIGSGVVAQGLAARDLARDQPYANSVGPDDLAALGNAATARIKYAANDNQPTGVGMEAVVPQGSPTKRYTDAFFDGSKIAANYRRSDGDMYDVSYNPNADKAYLAHELGHIVSDRTKVGNVIRSARSNPALAKALSTAAYLAPGAIAAVNPGDDDLVASLLASYAASAPIIADEFLASKNALAIMDSAGMRASMGQRGKLAGGLLTYLAAPLVAGTAANYAGNLMDDELVGPVGNY